MACPVEPGTIERSPPVFASSAGIGLGPRPEHDREAVYVPWGVPEIGDNDLCNPVVQFDVAGNTQRPARTRDAQGGGEPRHARLQNAGEIGRFDSLVRTPVFVNRTRFMRSRML